MVSSIVTSPDGKESSSSMLELETDLLGGATSVSRLHLRCEASLFDLYRASSPTVEIKEDRPQLASVMGHSLSGKKYRFVHPRLATNLLGGVTSVSCKLRK